MAGWLLDPTLAIASWPNGSCCMAATAQLWNATCDYLGGTDSINALLLLMSAVPLAAFLLGMHSVYVEVGRTASLMWTLISFPRTLVLGTICTAMFCVAVCPSQLTSMLTLFLHSGHCEGEAALD